MNQVIQALLIIALDLLIIFLALLVYGSVQAVRQGRRMQRDHIDAIANLREQFKISQERAKQERDKRELRQDQLKHLKRSTH